MKFSDPETDAQAETDGLKKPKEWSWGATSSVAFFRKESEDAEGRNPARGNVQTGP